MSGTTDFSVVAWVRILTANIQANGVSIIAQRDSSGSGYSGAYRIDLDSTGKVNFGIYNDSGGQQWASLISPSSVSDGNWHQITCVRSNGPGFIYVDGAQVATAAPAGGTTRSLMSSRGTYIGYNQRDGTLVGNTYWGEFKGHLAQIAIFGSALTSTQITNFYASAFLATAATPTFSPLPGGYVGATTVTASSESGSTVFYTTDGSTPTSASPNGGVGTGSATINIPVPTSVTIKAFAANTAKADILVGSGTFATVAAATWTILAGGSWASAANCTNTVIASGADVTAYFDTLDLTTDITVTFRVPTTICNTRQASAR